VYATSSTPEDLTKLPSRVLEHRVDVRDRRLTRLFRRWPTLTRAEFSELRQLYEERLRLAKALGAKRKRRRAP